MAKEKCKICGEELEKGFMDKVVGTVVRVKEGEGNKFYFVCSDCQKKFGDKLAEELKK